MRRASLYALTWIGLIGGLTILLFEPLDAGNSFLGAAFLAAGTAAVTSLIVRHSGPGHRGPDF